jgi:hypothetical protein
MAAHPMPTAPVGKGSRVRSAPSGYPPVPEGREQLVGTFFFFFLLFIFLFYLFFYFIFFATHQEELLRLG